MDTSNEYVGMCLTAKEIQEVWIPSEGDITVHSPYEGYHQIIILVEGTETGNLCYSDTAFVGDSDGDERNINGLSYYERTSRDIWLPRQDQLQKMMQYDSWNKRFAWVADLIRFLCFELSEDDSDLIETNEQLWLAYVMHKKNNKIWNGKDWEKF